MNNTIKILVAVLLIISSAVGFTAGVVIGRNSVVLPQLDESVEELSKTIHRAEQKQREEAVKTQDTFGGESGGEAGVQEQKVEGTE